ncbi:6129_t:CDS:2, partial [Paraglomus occultum]
ASLVKAQVQTGDVAFGITEHMVRVRAKPDKYSYIITTYNQTVTSTANFGNTAFVYFGPDVPPCTQSFVSVVVSPTDFARISNNQVFYAWDAQSCITSCVNTCTKTNPIPNPQTLAWCLVVSNPNNGIIPLKISYAFDNSAFTSNTGTSSITVTSATTNGVSSSPTTVGGAGAGSSSASGGYTATITLSSGVEKISLDSKSILNIGLACIVVIIQSLYYLL